MSHSALANPWWNAVRVFAVLLRRVCAVLNCQNLTDVAVPSGTTVGASAFFGCSRLSSVVLADDVFLRDGPTAQNGVFGGCPLLATVTVGNDVRIGAHSFYDNDGITSVQFSAGGHQSTLIGENAFFDCDGITTLNVPAGTTVGAGAFNSMDLLEQVTVGDDVTVADASNGGAVFRSNSGSCGVSGDSTVEVREVTMTTTTGVCVSDGGGNYANNERCTITLRAPVVDIHCCEPTAKQNGSTRCSIP